MTAAVAAIVISQASTVKAKQLSLAAASLLLLDVPSKASRFGVAFHLGSHFREDEANRVKATTPCFRGTGGKDIPGEVHVHTEPIHQPSVLFFDLAVRGEREKARCTCIVGQPMAGSVVTRVAKAAMGLL